MMQLGLSSLESGVGSNTSLLHLVILFSARVNTNCDLVTVSLMRSHRRAKGSSNGLMIVASNHKSQGLYIT